MKVKNNIQNVTEYMNSNPMHQLFVIEAVARYAAQCIEHEKQLLEGMKDSMIDGDAWLRAAKTWSEKHQPR